MQVLGAIFSAGIAAYLMYHHKRGETQASDTGFSMNMAGMYRTTYILCLNKIDLDG